VIDPARIAAILDRLPASIRPLSSGLDHLGIAVRDLDLILPFYRDLLGLELLYTETIESDGVRVAVLEFGGGHLELLEPTSADSPVARFIEKRGPGLHHVALRVSDCEAALSAAADTGFSLIDTVPRIGAGGKLIGFLHPKSTGGVLLELCQPGA
jgi:methylmalonyl-CoA/ethylmalonyl-CoA epimerase